MLKSVQNRPEKAKLLIDITSGSKQVDVPGMVLNENRDRLYIDEHYEDDDYYDYEDYFDPDDYSDSD